jgi:16S rRNA processing protein RimM
MSTAGDRTLERDFFVIARIVKARGIRGEVACSIETDFPERFSSLEEANVWMPDGTLLTSQVESCWFHKDRLILKFTHCDTMTEAQALVGGRLVITEAELRTLEEGEFFEHQILGAQAITSEGRALGSVSSVLRTGGTDVLVISDEDGREMLIPFADDICKSVNVAARQVVVDPPEGLLELNH